MPSYRILCLFWCRRWQCGRLFVHIATGGIVAADHNG